MGIFDLFFIEHTPTLVVDTAILFTASPAPLTAASVGTNGLTTVGLEMDIGGKDMDGMGKWEMVEIDGIGGIVGVIMVDREEIVGLGGTGVRALGVVVPVPG